MNTSHNEHYICYMHYNLSICRAHMLPDTGECLIYVPQLAGPNSSERFLQGQDCKASLVPLPERNTP